MIDSQTVKNGQKYWNHPARLAWLTLASAVCAIGLSAVLAPPLFAQSDVGASPEPEAVETTASEAPAAAQPQLPLDPSMEAYRIGVGDILSITVWKEPDHSMPTVVVRPDGKISLPLLRELFILGMTPLEAEDLLTERFKEFINNPNVTVVVREIRSQLVYVTGGVMRPGSLMMRPGMRVFQALSEAGGVAEYAKTKKMYVVRDSGGKRTTIEYDYKAVMAGEIDKDLVLRTGDTIVVPE